MGGGGGDNGYEARVQETESAKKAARAALNQQFGVAQVLDKSDFTDRMPEGGAGTEAYTPGYSQFNEGAYKQAQIAADAAVAKTKAAREAMYDDVRTNAYTAGKRGLDEGYDKAKRNNSFALFAQGLNGGSEDIDQNALLDRTRNQGLLDLGAKADGARADLQGSDEQTRLGLLQSIDNGMDQSSALSSAINQSQVAAKKAAADAQGTTLGDLFATSGALYTKSQAAQGKAAAQDWWNTYSANNGGKSNATARTGMVSAV